MAGLKIEELGELTAELGTYTLEDLSAAQSYWAEVLKEGQVTDKLAEEFKTEEPILPGFLAPDEPNGFKEPSATEVINDYRAVGSSIPEQPYFRKLLDEGPGLPEMLGVSMLLIIFLVVIKKLLDILREPMNRKKDHLEAML